jgi:hypothetical protein
MSTADWNRVISASVVPVVIISACGLLCLAFYNRLATIVSRLRGFQRVRLHERERLRGGADPDAADAQVRRRLLDLLEAQTSRVTRRAKLIRRTLMFLLLAIALLIACCLLLAVSVVVPRAAVMAVPVLLLGMLSMLAGIVTAMTELKSSLEPAELESQFVSTVMHPGGVPPAEDEA